MSGYDELLHRCIDVRIRAWADGINMVDSMALVIAEVLRTLETVTPEMSSQWEKTTPIAPFLVRADETIEHHEARLSTMTWLAMLHASPLAPPK